MGFRLPLEYSLPRSSRLNLPATTAFHNRRNKSGGDACDDVAGLFGFHELRDALDRVPDLDAGHAGLADVIAGSTDRRNPSRRRRGPNIVVHRSAQAPPLTTTPQSDRFADAARTCED